MTDNTATIALDLEQRTLIDKALTPLPFAVRPEGMQMQYYSFEEKLSSALAALADKGVSLDMVGQRMVELHPNVNYLTAGNAPRALIPKTATAIIDALADAETTDRRKKTDRYGTHREREAWHVLAPANFGGMLVTTLTDLCHTAGVTTIPLYNKAELDLRRTTLPVVAKAAAGTLGKVTAQKGVANTVALAAAFKRAGITPSGGMPRLPDISNLVSALFEPLGIKNENVARFLQHQLNPDGGDVKNVNDPALGVLATRDDIWDALAAAYLQVVARNEQYSVLPPQEKIALLTKADSMATLKHRLRELYTRYEINCRSIANTPEAWMYEPLAAAGITRAQLDAAYAAHPFATDFERLPPEKRGLPTASNVQLRMWCDVAEQLLARRKEQQAGAGTPAPDGTPPDVATVDAANHTPTAGPNRGNGRVVP